MSTIFAVSSGRPPAAIAVIRISGPGAFAVVEQMAGPLPEPRYAALRALRDELGELIDRALVLIFPRPASVTGDDVVELHCHGGRAVVQAVEARLARAPGLRRAEPGEFTRRGLLNGRLDLAQAESLADLLEAETETLRRAALAGVEGQVSGLLRGWMDIVADLSARIEVAIDYSEEDDGDHDAAIVSQVCEEMLALSVRMQTVLDAPSVERLRDPVTVVIAGPTNSGKSSLFNRLVEREAAIVSSQPGTTRDVLEAAVVRDGMAYQLIDTAGLNDGSADIVEIEGIRRATIAAQTSDLLIWTGDDMPPRADALWLHMRTDLPDRRVRPDGPVMAVSTVRDVAITQVWDLIAAGASQLLRGTGVAFRDSQRVTIASIVDGLASSVIDPIIVAEILRHARENIAQLLGIRASEALLDRLFSRFCLGK